jgi:hypothetical protein
MNTKRPRNNRNNQRRGGGQGGGSGRPNSFDSNGPDVKIRGNPSQIFEKYQSLAQDAATSGDRVMSENYFQHAEHYYRVSSEMNAQRQQQQQRQQSQSQHQRQEGQDSQDGQNRSDNAVAVEAEEAPQEAAQEAVVEKKEPVAEVPSDPANEPQPVIE